MHRSRILSALFSLLFFGVLALAPSGCSNEASGFTSPGDGVPAMGDDTAPAMPTGLSVVKATADGFRLEWTPNTEVDLAGYRVYVYQPSPCRENAYLCPHGTALISGQENWYVYVDDTSVGPHYFKLSAVDQAGNESARFGPYAFSFSPSPRNGSVDDGQPSDQNFRPSGGWQQGQTGGRNNGIEGDGVYR